MTFNVLEGGADSSGAGRGFFRSGGDMGASADIFVEVKFRIVSIDFHLFVAPPAGNVFSDRSQKI
jgi:hypothetical protein